MFGRKTSIVVLLAALCLPFGTALGADLKIGFVDAGKVSSKAPQAEAARAKLQKEFAPRDRDIAAQQKEVQKLEDKLQRDGAVMSQDQRDELQHKIVSMKRDVRRSQDEFRDDFNMRRNEELSKLQRRIVEVIDQLAKEKGFDLIVSDGVIFASDRINITDMVLQRLQQEYKASQKGDKGK